MNFSKLLFASLLFFCSCSFKHEQHKQEDEKLPTIETTPAPEPYVAPAEPTKGHYKNFGFSGSLFRNMVPGEIFGIEGGLLALYTKDAKMYAFDTEPNDNRGPIDQRKMYMVRISDSISAKCGVLLPEFKTVPGRCVINERILSWEETKKFMLDNSTGNEEYIKEIEKFLKDRSRPVDNQ